MSQYFERSFTHKGWFGLCPVFIDQPHSECPVVVERHGLLLPLFVLSCGLFWILNAIATLVAPGREPGFLLTVTRRLRAPVTLRIKSSEVKSV